MNVVVIGGGPAGMMSAISSAENGNNVILLEKKERLGRKLLITGKGRCNITSSLPINEFIQNIPGNGQFLYSAFKNYTNNDRNPTTNELFGIDDNGNEVPILKLLYPDYKYTEDGINLNTEKSKYKYLANILKYSTATSVSVNQYLFLTESKDFNDITKNVHQLIGRSFTDEQYNTYKRYLVSMLYNNIHIHIHQYRK